MSMPETTVPARSLSQTRLLSVTERDESDRVKLTPSVRSPKGVSPWALYGAWRRWGLLAILFLVTTSNYFDFYILSVVLEPIKHEFHVSDTMLGFLSGLCFAVVYAFAGLPIARWADRGNRRTIITLALTGWSVMTAVCGLAHSFWQLAFARFGLGIVEPGALPPAQSLIADYFPPDRRATASAILTAGSAAGYLMGIALGGYIAATHGWRAAFFVAGGLGLVLAVVVRLALAEPRCQLGFPGAVSPIESMHDAFSQLRRKPTFLYALIGTSVYTVFAFGLNIFVPSLMIRTLHATLKEISLTWGFAISAAALIGAVAGGQLADRLGKRDIRWYAWLPGIACAAAAPLYWMALAARQLWSFIAMDFLAETVVTVGMSLLFVAMHAVCGNRRRTTAIALAQLAFTLIGAGLGPLIAGALSDAYSGAHGDRSLQYSLNTMVGFLIPAAVAFYWAGRSILQDVED